MLWHSAANCKVSKFSHFFAFFSGTTGLILIKLWFLFMLWHSAATCNVSKFSSLFCIFLRNYWSDLDQTLIFVSCYGILKLIVKFQNFLHFFAFFSGTTGFILIKLWFLFMLWNSAANCNVSKFSSLFAFFWGTTGLILIKLWFLFMLWHSTANCKVSKFSHFFCIFLGNYCFHLDQTLIFVHAVVHSAANCKISSLFCIFLRNYWFDLDQIFDFCSCCCIVQLIVKFQNFLTFLHFSQELLLSSWSNFDFCSCCGTLQPIAKVSNFLTFFAFFPGTTGLILIKSLIFVHAVALCKPIVQSFKIFSVFCIFPRNYWFDLDQTLIFVYAVALCSHLQSFQIFFTFLHFSEELLIWSWSNFDFCLCCWHSAANCKVSKFSHFLAFFWRTTGLHQTLIFVHAVAFCRQLQSFTNFLSFWHFSQELLVWSWSNFDFYLCCDTLQVIVKF